jgi:hypothetical protein
MFLKKKIKPANQDRLRVMMTKIEKEREEKVWRKIAGTWDWLDELKLRSDLLNFLLLFYKIIKEETEDDSARK